MIKDFAATEIFRHHYDEFDGLVLANPCPRDVEIVLQKFVVVFAVNQLIVREVEHLDMTSMLFELLCDLQQMLSLEDTVADVKQVDEFVGPDELLKCLYSHVAGKIDVGELQSLQVTSFESQISEHPSDNFLIRKTA